MKKFKLFPLILIICLIMAAAAPAACALDQPQLNGKAMLLVDRESGKVLYQLNADQQRAPASLTKVMTVLVALDALDRGQITLEDMVTAQADCREGMSEDSSTSGIVPGVQISMKDLLYCALLQSANEACNIIGSYVSGSVSAFVEEMNRKAQELGCENTHFVNTNGLPADGHYSSARDLYIITEAAARYPLFMEICNTKSYKPDCTAINETIYNSNALICAESIYGNGKYLYEFASGVKTGYTRAAGYCLISTAEKNNIKLLGVVMGCDGALNSNSEDYWNFIDSRVLYDWGFDNFSYRTVLGATEVISSVPVKLSQGGVSAILRPANDVTVLMPNDAANSDITRSVTVYSQDLTAPVAAGTVLGEMTLSYNGEVCGTVKLVNSTDVELSKSDYMKMRISQVFSKGWVMALIGIVAVFVLLYTVLVMRYRRLRRRYLKQRREAERQRQYERMQTRADEQRRYDRREEYYDEPEDEGYEYSEEPEEPDEEYDIDREISRYFDEDFNSDYRGR